MATFGYPTNAELQEIEQDFLPRLQKDRPIFDIMPMENIEDDILMWEQEDNYTGLQTLRGLGGEPGRVKKVGVKRYTVLPGVYGDMSPLDEHELTRRRQFGTFATAIDISDLVQREQIKLLQRRLDIIEYIGWTLIATGTFSVASPNGAVVHTDTFSTQTFTASPLWSNLSGSTPMADLRTIKLKARGKSVDFGARATLYANQGVVNNMLNNTNANDIGGKKTMFGANILDLETLNKILLTNDLPQIVPMDKGYIDDSGTFQLFLPNGSAVLVGKRTSGTPIATYGMTRNANNPDLAPGPYTKVVDKGEHQVPRLIEVHDGHNGGPMLKFPSGIVSITC